MAYTDFIAAIDLGSSHMVGMVGAKGPAGDTFHHCLRSGELRYLYTKRMCI